MEHLLDGLRLAGTPRVTDCVRRFLMPTSVVGTFETCQRAVCTENLIRVDDVMESPKLAE